MRLNRRQRRGHFRMDWFQPGRWLLYGVLGLIALIGYPLLVYRNPSDRMNWILMIGLAAAIFGTPIVSTIYAAFTGGEILLTLSLSLITGVVLAGIFMYAYTAVILAWRIIRRGLSRWPQA